ncbi:hypothetical protein ACFL02_09850, partial [Planctomycetota bacterium]
MKTHTQKATLPAKTLSFPRRREPSLPMTLNRSLHPNLVIPAQPAFVQAQAGTQSPPNPDPSLSKNPNPVYLANPVNLVKILTVK